MAISLLPAPFPRHGGAYVPLGAGGSIQEPDHAKGRIEHRSEQNSRSPVAGRRSAVSFLLHMTPSEELGQPGGHFVGP